MGGYFTLQVGGVGLNVGGNAPLMSDRVDAAYSDFRLEFGSSGGDSLEITITVSDPVEPGPEGTLWESGDAWALYRHRGNRVISGPPRLRAWSAEMDGERVTVRCGRAMSRRKGGRMHAVNPVRYPLDQLLLMYALARRRGFIVHSCGADVAGKGALFLGRSGAGKSTLARLLTGAGDCTVLSDDRMIVRMNDGGATMYGTPWPGEAGMAVNRSVPVVACFVLSKAAENRIEDLPSAGVAEALLPVVSIPWYEQDVASAVVEACEALVSAVPLRVLHFRKDADAVAMVKDAVNRGQR